MNYKLLNDARINLKWSIEKTAEECKVPFQTVKNVLTGNTKNSRIDTIIPIARVLNVPLETLFETDENNIIKEEIIEEMVEEVIESVKEEKVPEVSVIALKEIYEHQITAMKEANDEHIKNIREHYERHISDLKEHYERRLADKREHIETISLDKKWFRLASVFGVVALICVFLFIEFMTPGHGWFIFEK